MPQNPGVKPVHIQIVLFETVPPEGKPVLNNVAYHMSSEYLIGPSFRHKVLFEFQIANGCKLGVQVLFTVDSLGYLVGKIVLAHLQPFVLVDVLV